VTFPALASVPLAGLALGVPITFVLSALLGSSSADDLARRASRATALSLALAASFAAGSSLAPLFGSVPGPSLGVLPDRLTHVMLLLVCSIALIIVRYSRRYLEGEPRSGSYFRWLLLTLGAVTSLVVTDSLLVLAIAWTLTSLALHRLLTFYPDRPAAIVAAHKKFLVSRLADVSLWTALGLLHHHVGSLRLGEVGRWAVAQPTLPPAVQLATVLLVATVALKSAQLPFHGWLLQVMEAPTPVSALLHAGIVNIGGFVLLRLAPLLDRASLAQALLLGCGLVTTVLASLVMTTRVSVKVALAWSTCAQMGFLLVECGLGAWHLALLHLVAHSLYKAHAFLNAGSTVDELRVRALAPAATPRAASHVARDVAVILSAAAVGVAAFHALLGAKAPLTTSSFVLATVVSLSLVPLLGQRGQTSFLATAALALRAAGVAGLSGAVHVGAAWFLPSSAPAHGHDLGWLCLGASLVVLFALKTALSLWPTSPWARAWYPPLFAGFWLDEGFTGAAFRLWPPPRAVDVEASPTTLGSPVEVRP
jgi:NAD(P)H-quinone oxidoreductase subunit 5